MGRGLDGELARKVAVELMAHDALGAHARDELGISEIITAARPMQAAFASAASFATGAALPLLVVLLAPQRLLVRPPCRVACVPGDTRRHFRKNWRRKPLKAAVRVVFWGGLAMAVTSAVGALVGRGLH